MDKGSVRYKINDIEFNEISTGIDTDKRYRFVINTFSSAIVKLL